MAKQRKKNQIYIGQVVEAVYESLINNDNDEYIKLSPTSETIIARADYPELANTMSTYDWEVTQTITNPDSVSGASFGLNGDMTPDGTRIVVGAPYDSTSGGNQGRFYVYVWNGSSYIYEDDIVNPITSQTGNLFGNLLKINNTGTRIFVGVGAYTSGTGRVYTYTRSGSVWSLEDTIDNPTATTGQHFGSAIDIDKWGTRLVVGAYGTTSSQGAAYTYRLVGSVWTQETTLTPDTVENGSRFGRSVTMASGGQLCAVGQHLRTVNTKSNVGAVHTYIRNNIAWTRQTSIFPEGSEEVANTDFGRDVQFVCNDDELLYIFRDGTPRVSQGYKYDQSVDKWRAATTIGAMVLPEESYTIDISVYPDSIKGSNNGNRIIHNVYDFNSPYGNLVAILTKTGCAWDYKLIPPIGYPTVDIGAAGVGISGDGETVVIGNYADDTAASGAGAIRIYKKTLADTTNIIIPPVSRDNLWMRIK